MRLSIRDPLACLADGAGRGVVVEAGKIAELVAAGSSPAQPVDEVFDAARHVLLPGLVNSHHHMYQTLTRAHPEAIRLCRSAAEIEAARVENTIAALLHIEGVEAIGPDLDALHLYHAAGLRSLGPVWSRPNIFGHGVPFNHPACSLS